MKTRLASFAPVIPVLALAVIGWPQRAGADPYIPEYTQGNYFYSSSSGSAGINSTNGRYVRFTAYEDTQATSVSININTASLTATSLTFGLQADDGAGKPTGTFLASGTVTGPVAGWNTVTFSGYQLVAGQTYHVVAQPEASGNAYWRLLTSPPPMNFQTYGVKDTSYAYGATNSSGVPLAAEPTSGSAIVYMVGTTSHGIGQAYQSNSSTLLTSTAALAQRFQFVSSVGDQAAFDSVTVRLTTGAADLKDVRISLLNDANIVLATTILDGDSLQASTSGDYTVSFSEAPILTAGESYKLALYSAETGASTVKWVVSKTNSLDAVINSASFQGTDGYAFSYSGIDFSAMGPIVLGDDYGFSYTATAIPEPGSVVSALLGLGIVGMALRRKI